MVTDCWVSRTKFIEPETKRPLYDTQSLCEVPEVVYQFSLCALDRCGVRYGASHLEVIVDEDGECRLIELNARLAGDFPRAHGCYDESSQPRLLPDHEKLGINQFSMLALSVANEEEFLRIAQLWNQRPNTRIKEHVTAVFLRTLEECKISGRGMAAICMLPSFNGFRRSMGHLPVPAQFHPLKLALHPEKGQVEWPRFAEVGSQMGKTVSLRSCPGVVLLRSSHEEAIQRDVDAIRELEKDGLYICAPW